MTGQGNPSAFGGMSASTAEATMRRRASFQEGAVNVMQPLQQKAPEITSPPKDSSVITMRPDLSGVGLGGNDQSRRSYQGGWGRLMPTKMGMSETTYKSNAYRLQPFLPPQDVSHWGRQESE